MFYQKKPAFTGLGRGKYFQSDNSPLFPFGYGLSYTKFDISNLRLSKTNIKPEGETILSVDVKNTGAMEGDEVVQVYVSDEFASVGRWEKELKAFKRVTLQAGETKTLDFKTGFDELFLFDSDYKKVVEPEKFFLRVGNSSEKLKSIELIVDGAFVENAAFQKVKQIADEDDAIVVPNKKNQN